jgi:hypothetical protein
MTMKTDKESHDPLDYCLDFWEGAIDAEDEIDHIIREMPRHVRAADDVA